VSPLASSTLRRHWRGVALLGIAALALMAWAVGQQGLSLDALQALLRRLVMQGAAWYALSPAVTVAAFVLVFAALSALALPGSSILAVGAGAVFGVAFGALLVAGASALGATLPFLFARRFGRVRLRDRFPDWWHAIDAGVARRGVRYLLLLRLAPVIPFAVVNPLMGLTTMRTWTFFWASALGMLFGSFLYTAAGAGLSFWAQG
jgi:uncharacterized membrane protein YdjX (TVP38/TMEM64 family)